MQKCLQHVHCISCLGRWRSSLVAPVQFIACFRSESAITRGNTIMLLLPTSFSKWNTSILSQYEDNFILMAMQEDVLYCLLIEKNFNFSLNGRKPKKFNTACPELGTAQPQHVSNVHHLSNI